MKKYHIRNINGIDADESGTVTIAIPLQVLESIDEGNGVGYVIANRNPLNYGNVGLNAVAAASGGVSVGQMYHTAGVVKIRLS